MLIIEALEEYALSTKVNHWGSLTITHTLVLNRWTMKQTDSRRYSHVIVHDVPSHRKREVEVKVTVKRRLRSSCAGRWRSCPVPAAVQCSCGANPLLKAGYTSSSTSFFEYAVGDGFSWNYWWENALFAYCPYCDKSFQFLYLAPAYLWFGAYVDHCAKCFLKISLMKTR